jgi:hypothetical protein
MRELILRFLGALDEALVPHAQPGERLDLYLIGHSALILHRQVLLQSGGTQDIDVVRIEIAPEQTRLLQTALDLFGMETDRARLYGLYLHAVDNGIPPVPGWFRMRSAEVSGTWRVVRLWELDVHDLAATKLERYSPKDREDLRALCDRGLLQEALLRASFEKAFEWSTDKDGDQHRDTASANLGRVVSYLNGESRAL